MPPKIRFCSQNRPDVLKVLIGVLEETIRANGSRLELSSMFGTEKQHYSLDKVKAKTKHTEILWIFFISTGSITMEYTLPMR